MTNKVTQVPAKAVESVTALPHIPQYLVGWLSTEYRPDLDLDRFPLLTPQPVKVGLDGHWAWIDLPGCFEVYVEANQEGCVVRIQSPDGTLLHSIALPRQEEG